MQSPAPHLGASLRVRANRQPLSAAWVPDSHQPEPLPRCALDQVLAPDSIIFHPLACLRIPDSLYNEG